MKKQVLCSQKCSQLESLRVEIPEDKFGSLEMAEDVGSFLKNTVSYMCFLEYSMIGDHRITEL